MMRNILCALVLLSACSISFSAEPGATTNGKVRIYVCEDGYEPPCRLVKEIDTRASQTDWAELLAASRASKSGVETPVIRSDYGPIPQCGPHHGQSACCRIIAEIAGKRYIQCGPT